MLALRLWLSATPETDAPSWKHCRRTWAFNCALYARRFGTPSVDSLSIVSTISLVYTMPYLVNQLKMGSPSAYGGSLSRWNWSMKSLDEAQYVGTKWEVDPELGGDHGNFVIHQEKAIRIWPA